MRKFSDNQVEKASTAFICIVSGILIGWGMWLGGLIMLAIFYAGKYFLTYED